MKKYSHSRVYGNRVMNWRTAVLSLSIVGIFVLSHYGNIDNTYTAEKKVVKQVFKKESIEDKIKKHFPKNGITMIAVAKAESQMNPKAIGYNCFYINGKATTTPIKGGSRSCKVEDRKISWSLDCGILQINTKEKKCPVETIDEHLQRAAILSKVQGLGAWISWKNKTHEVYLTQK